MTATKTAMTLRNALLIACSALRKQAAREWRNADPTPAQNEMRDEDIAAFTLLEEFAAALKEGDRP